MIALPELQDADLILDGRVATLTMQRDDVRNALTGTHLIDDIVRTVEWANVNPAVSVLVLTGAGAAFSAGGNVKDMAQRGGDFAGDVAEVEERYRRGIQRIPLALHKAEIPIIAAVNGPAIGAGFDLACMCDLRLGTPHTVFGETFLNLGIIPGDGGAWFLQRLVGYQRAAELTLTGRLVRAEEALALGLLLEVVPEAELLERAHALARHIARQPPKALRLTKRLLKIAQRENLPDFLDRCACFQGMCHNSEEHQVAVQEFLARQHSARKSS